MAFFLFRKRNSFNLFPSMNLLILSESWLDLAAIVLGGFSTVVCVIMGIRLLEWSDLKPDLTGWNQPGLIPQLLTNTGEGLSTVRISVANTQSWLESKEVVAAPVKRTGLSFKRIKQLGTNEVRISLKVESPQFQYQRMEAGPYNELEVSYTPPVFRQKEIFSKGAALNFSIKGADLSSATYQFWVYFQDEIGNSFKQEVMGLGTETPLFEAPIRA